MGPLREMGAHRIRGYACAGFSGWRSAADRALPGGQAARQRRHGARVPGPVTRRPAAGHQGHPGRAGRRRRVPDPLPARSRRRAKRERAVHGAGGRRGPGSPCPLAGHCLHRRVLAGGHRHPPRAAARRVGAGAGGRAGRRLLAIHSAGLVHRDLKPSNVLMADDGPRVIDFGISRAMEASTVTTTGMVVGSPGFMSPEQAEGLEVGPPSDVFSLGAVLAFAATGEGPFGSGSSAALIYRLVHNFFFNNRATTETRALIERCLDKDPGRRPSPRQLLAELGEASLAPGWLPEPLVQDTGQPGPDTPRPAPGMSAPPAFGAPSASFPAAPHPGSPASPSPAAGAGDPLTVTHARLSQPVPPPWPG